MSESLFNEVGPHKIRRTGPHTYEMNVSLSKDADGRTARACPANHCSPGYFKIKNGTGIPGDQALVHCPYCGHSAEPNDFTTKGQSQYANDVMMREAHPGISRMLKDALGLGSSGKRSFGGGLFSVELSIKPGSPPSVGRPFEQALQPCVVCPHRGLDHAVFGLAVWCPDCGCDIFITHVEAEFSVTQTMLSDVERRRNELGSRVAARDIENCLEDTVSIMKLYCGPASPQFARAGDWR
jgi:hypothetical protein